MRHNSRWILTGLFLLTLTGCGSLFLVEGTSAVISGKTVSDHAVSILSGKDCSGTRTQRGQTYCVEDELVINQSSLYCYRTLGGVTCYDQPDQRRSADQRVGKIVATPQ